MTVYRGRIQLLAKPASEWTAADPVLLNGEVGVSDPATSVPILKVGDGVRPWSTLPGIAGGGGAAPNYVVGSTTTLAPGAFATVTIDNTVSPPTISFGIPRGSPGPANSLAIGTVTTGAPGTPAAATITGVPPAQTINLTIPMGPPGPQGFDGVDGATGDPGPAGPANTLTIGTVTTGAPGSAAAATITGTAPAQVLSLTIPQGPVGPQGIQGIQGPEGPQGPSGDSSGIVTGDTHVTGEWYFDPTTWFGYTAAQIASVKAIAPLYSNDAFESAHFLGRLRMERENADPFIRLGRVNGSFAVPTRLLTGDIFGRFQMGGMVDSIGGFSTGVSLQAVATQDWTITNFPAQLQFHVVAPNNVTPVNVANVRGDRVEFIPPTFHGFSAADVASLVASPVAAFDPTDGIQINTRAHVERQNSGVPLYLRRWNGTYAAPTAVLNGDNLGALHFTGTTGPSSAAQAGGSVQADALADWTPTSSPGCINIYATPVGGVTIQRVAQFRANGIDLGNAATNPPITFLGTGAVTLGGPLRLPNGTVGAPSYSFATNPTTGMYLAAANVIDFAVGGQIGLRLAPSGVYPFAQIYNVPGNAAAPGYSFDGDPDLGFYSANVNEIRVSTGNFLHTIFNQSSLQVQVPIWGTDGAVGGPGIAFANDPDTGFYRRGSGDMALSINGQMGAVFSATQNAFTLAPVYHIDGTVALPGMGFNNDVNTGFHRPSSDALQAVAGGMAVATFLGTGATAIPRLWMQTPISCIPGTVSLPGLTFEGDLDTGLYLHGGAGQLGFAVDGVAILRLHSTFTYSSVPFLADPGSISVPTYSFNGDGNTGFYQQAADVIGATCGGALRVRMAAGGQPLAVHAAGDPGQCYIGYYRVNGTTRKCYLGYGDSNSENFYVMNEETAGATILGTSGVARLTISNVGAASFASTVSATSYTSTSSRAIKRETGAPKYAADILARLRPILYRLLVGDDNEQLGLVAEEVHDICPQLSDGKTVAYDRLALLLLADWQDQRARAVA